MKLDTVIGWKSNPFFSAVTAAVRKRNVPRAELLFMCLQVDGILKVSLLVVVAQWHNGGVAGLGISLRTISKSYQSLLIKETKERDILKLD